MIWDLRVTNDDLRSFRHSIGSSQTIRTRQADNLDIDSLTIVPSKVVKLSQKSYAFCVFRLSGIIKVKKQKTDIR
ncbi:hypothetical protein, partial [Pararhodonellum marinum]|uniref:hypothetical protein n=1 Tax=Pararhodonellum marinum TaxID=2755358 RepID=UPI001E62808C